jgi:hypothetical protein
VVGPVIAAADGPRVEVCPGALVGGSRRCPRLPSSPAPTTT